MFNSSHIIFLYLGLAWCLLGCSDSDHPNSCHGVSSIPLEFNSCLSIEHPNLPEAEKIMVENLITSGFKSINALMDIDQVLIRVVSEPNLVVPEIGIGGFNPSSDEVIIAINERHRNLADAIDQALVPVLAHELHHAKRRRSVGYGNSLLKAAVTEGLADHFAIEVTGIDPFPWSTALTAPDLEEWTNTASDTWNNPFYFHNRWFLGSDPSIPRWTGYAIGFDLVSNYLDANRDHRPSTLHDEPASSFEP